MSRGIALLLCLSMMCNLGLLHPKSANSCDITNQVSSSQVMNANEPLYIALDENFKRKDYKGGYNNVHQIDGYFPYKGDQYRFRIAVITPLDERSALVGNVAEMVGEGKHISANQDASVVADVALKCAVSEGVGNTLESCHSEIVTHAFEIKGWYDIFAKIPGIISSYNQQTVIDDASETLHFAFNKSVTYIYIQRDGRWYKAYEGDCVIGNFATLKRMTVAGFDAIASDSGCFEEGTTRWDFSLSENENYVRALLQESCNNVIRDRPQYTFNKVWSVSIHSNLIGNHEIGTMSSVGGDEPTSLGMDRFENDITPIPSY